MLSYHNKPKGVIMSLEMKDILDFVKIQVNLKKTKKDELSLRKKIIGHFRYKGSEGIQHKEFEDAKVDVTLKISRSLDAEVLDASWSSLSQAEKDCIENVPKLNLKMYKALVEEGGATELMACVTEKPAQASVTIKLDD